MIRELRNGLMRKMFGSTDIGIGTGRIVMKK
jgi:hypothetical protein